jgi:hypothetical protein
VSDVVGHHHTEETDHHVWGRTDYRILQCRGCEAVYFQTDSICSEDLDYGELDPQTGEHELLNIASEIYVSLNDDLRILSAIGVCTAFDQASRLLGVDSRKTFIKKLCALYTMDKIGLDEKEALNILPDGGNAAEHKEWKPEPEGLDTMMNVIEAFLYRTFILEAQTKKLKGNIRKQQETVVDSKNKDPLPHLTPSQSANSH